MYNWSKAVPGAECVTVIDSKVGLRSFWVATVTPVETGEVIALGRTGKPLEYPDSDTAHRCAMAFIENEKIQQGAVVTTVGGTHARST